MKQIYKHIVTTVLIGVVVFVIGNAFYGDFRFDSFNEFLVNIALYQLYSFVLAFSNMVFFHYLQKVTWEKYLSKSYLFTKRFLIGIMGSIVITLVGLFFLRSFTEVIINGKSYEEFLSNDTLSNYGFGLWITLSIVLVFHIIYYYNQHQQKKIKEQKVIAGTARARFDALKNQLDPHFLFNSLNVLTSLIEENPESAQKFTTSLSKIYRYVLEQKNKDLVTVEEELKFAKTYMSLLQMRFEDAITFSIPEKIRNPDLKIVPLSLQLLLENAVKHNVISANQPLIIKIYERDNFLVVENNSNPKATIEKSTKVGLKNIKQRYGLMTSQPVEISEINQSFKVAIPLLTQNTNIMRTREFNNDNNKYLRAKQRVDELKGFYGNLISYCCVIPLLIFINYKTYWGFQWFWFPMAGWGIGIAIHAFTVFGYGAHWEERKIREFMEKEERNF